MHRLYHIPLRESSLLSLMFPMGPTARTSMAMGMIRSLQRLDQTHQVLECVQPLRAHTELNVFHWLKRARRGSLTRRRRSVTLHANAVCQGAALGRAVCRLLCDPRRAVRGSAAGEPAPVKRDQSIPVRQGRLRQERREGVGAVPSLRPDGDVDRVRLLGKSCNGDRLPSHAGVP